MIVMIVGWNDGEQDETLILEVRRSGVSAEEESMPGRRECCQWWEVRKAGSWVA